MEPQWGVAGKHMPMPHPQSFTSCLPHPPPQAYVLDYNIYALEVTETETTPIPVTSGGSKNGIVYGIPDWVYEGKSHP